MDWNEPSVSTDFRRFKSGDLSGVDFVDIGEAWVATCPGDAEVAGASKVVGPDVVLRAGVAWGRFGWGLAFPKPARAAAT